MQIILDDVEVDTKWARTLATCINSLTLSKVLTIRSFKIIKKEKVQTIKSNNFIGHNIFLYTLAHNPI
jgi:hypothetical protein